MDNNISYNIRYQTDQNKYYGSYLQNMNRITKLKPIIKKVAVGAAILTVTSGVAYSLYAKYNNSSKAIQNIVSNQLITQKINEQITTQLKTQQQSNIQLKGASQIVQNKQNVHHHDTDIRILDMVGYPSPHGTHILEPQPANDSINNQTKTVEVVFPQKTQDIQQQVLAAQNDNKQIQAKNYVKQVQVKTVQPIKQQAIAKTTKNKINKALNYQKISQIPQFNPNQQISSDSFAIIVVDMPYNESFEKQIMKKLDRTVKNRKSQSPLLIYRADLNNSKIRKILQQKYNSESKQETILLMKNPYENRFTNLDFDMYIQYANLPAIYLSQLKIAQTPQQIENQLNRMTANQTYLLYSVDFGKDTQLNQRKLAAKYIEMELGINNMQNVKLLVADQKTAKQLGIISPQVRSNSLHLIRKNNEFTYKPANRNLFADKKPYNVIESITFYDKNKTVAIPKHLSKIQTFNSIGIQSPYAVSITIDRNKISPRQQRQVLKVFAKLKAEDSFPSVSYILKFAQSQYRGQKEQPFANKKFTIKLANLDQLDKHLQMHELKTREDLAALGVQYKKWLKDSYQYLYKQAQVTEEGVKKFISRCLQGQEPQFYKSQAKHKLQTIHKLTANTFNQILFIKNSKNSHLVFEYSDHCQTCQILAPLIQHFDDVCKKFPNIGTQVHALNCDKNRVKGQTYSPYTPNLYYYSKNWKNTQPMKYPILQFIGQTNLWGIYDFCTITEELSKIDEKKFDEHIQQFLNANIKLSDF